MITIMSEVFAELHADRIIHRCWETISSGSVQLSDRHHDAVLDPHRPRDFPPACQSSILAVMLSPQHWSTFYPCRSAFFTSFIKKDLTSVVFYVWLPALSTMSSPALNSTFKSVLSPTLPNWSENQKSFLTSSASPHAPHFRSKPMVTTSKIDLEIVHYFPGFCHHLNQSILSGILTFLNFSIIHFTYVKWKHLSNKYIRLYALLVERSNW